MTPREFKECLDDLKKMSHEDCARLWRFAPFGNVYFSNEALYEEFQKHFKSLGGMTPEISKKIGWGD